MDEDDELVIRRILSSQGSFAGLDQRPQRYRQPARRTLANCWFEIHGQHEHQQLEKPQTQRRLLDQQIPDETTLAVRSAHADWQSACQAKSDFDADAGDPAQLELLRFQVSRTGRSGIGGRRVRIQGLETRAGTPGPQRRNSQCHGHQRRIARQR